MTSLAVKPQLAADDILPGAQFVDAYRVALAGPAIDARAAAERMLTRSPAWVGWLMALRNRLVAPFGLRRPGWSRAGTKAAIGMFPIVSETPGRLIAGFNDSHLDFRLVVDVVGDASGQSVTATTIVKMNNLLGRAYLAAIMPFHRLIVQRMLLQVNTP